jgi:hypothetical protein
MSKRDEDERMRALRDDPDFRALAKTLRDQTPEQVEAFLEEFDKEPELDENPQGYR